MSPSSTRQWILNEKPTDMPVLSGPSPTFRLATTPLQSLSQDQVLLKTLYLSNDPAQRGWISRGIDPARLYLPPVEQGAVMRAGGIAEVLESTSPKFAKGSLVVATTNWSEYSVLDAVGCQPVQEIPGLSHTHYLGALGMTGITAYYGIKEIAKAAPGDTVVVSGAAGATGSMVVQIAKKMIGCKRVIGMAGTDEKCRWVESLGADVCLNYKSPDFEQQLIKATPNFADVYFDNVGGGILDLMLKRMARHGRIAACGAVSNYNTSQPTGLRNYLEVISMRIQILGFIVLDFLPKAPAAIQEMVRALKEGKIVIGDESETVVEAGFEDIPRTWMTLFEGGNTGKLVTKLVTGGGGSSL